MPSMFRYFIPAPKLTIAGVASVPASYLSGERIGISVEKLSTPLPPSHKVSKSSSSFITAKELPWIPNKLLCPAEHKAVYCMFDRSITLWPIYCEASIISFRSCFLAIDDNLFKSIILPVTFEQSVLIKIFVSSLIRGSIELHISLWRCKDAWSHGDEACRNLQ